MCSILFGLRCTIKWPTRMGGTARERSGKAERKWSKAVENEGQDPAPTTALSPANAKGQWRCLYKINEQTFPAAKSNYQEAPQEEGTEPKPYTLSSARDCGLFGNSSNFVLSVERKGNVETFRTTTSNWQDMQGPGRWATSSQEPSILHSYY